MALLASGIKELPGLSRRNLNTYSLGGGQEPVGEPSNGGHARGLGPLVDHRGALLIGFHDRGIEGNDPRDGDLVTPGELPDGGLIPRGADLVRHQGDTADAKILREGERALSHLERLEVRLGDEEERVHVASCPAAQVFESGLEIDDGHARGRRDQAPEHATHGGVCSAQSPGAPMIGLAHHEEGEVLSDGLAEPLDEVLRGHLQFESRTALAVGLLF